MDVAVVSVVSSGLVAVGSLGFQWRNGNEQRRHDATQAFEARAWDLKRESHLELLETLSRIKDHANDGYAVAAEGVTWLESFYSAQAAIVAYGSDECRGDLDTLMDFVGDLGPLDEEVAKDVNHALGMEDALAEIVRQGRKGNFLPMSDTLEAKNNAEQRVRDSFTYDDAALRNLVNKLIDSTRRSLRGGL